MTNDEPEIDDEPTSWQYHKVLVENEKYRIALEFYGKEENWSCSIHHDRNSPVEKDEGKIAREALNES